MPPPVLAHVSEYMTPGPFVVGPREPLANAARLMEQHGLHHLPVAEDELVGIVSNRDVELFKAFPFGLLEAATVEQAMTRDPYAPSPDTALIDVVRTMAERRIGSAVIVDRGRIVGVFTATDVMRLLVDAFEGKLFEQFASPRAESRAIPPRRRATRRTPAR